MLRTAGLEARLGLDLSDFQKGIRNASRALEPIQKRMQEVGRRMTTAITVPVTAAGYAVARMGGDFQYSMNRVQALSGSTGSQLEALSDQAKELGISTQFSASQAADAMGFLAMAGFDANQILGTMPATLDLAAASGMQLPRAADVLSNVMQGYALATAEAARASDVLTKAFTSSNTDLGQLAEAMKYAGPVAAGMGVEFEEAAAAIGLMGNAGIQGSMAGTSLRNALSRLARPTGEVRAAMERLGLSVQDLSPTTASLTEIVERLQASGASTSDMLTIFGQRAGPAMQALIDQGADSLRDFTGTLREAGGEASRVASVQMQGFEGSMKALRSAIQGVAIEIAEAGVLDFLEQMARRAAGLVRVVANLNPVLLRAGAVIGGLAAATGPLLLGLGALTKALPVVAAGIGLLTSPITLTIAAVAALGATAWYVADNWEATVDSWRSTFEQYKLVSLAALSTIASGFESFFRFIKPELSQAAAAARAALQSAMQGIDLSRPRAEFAALGDYVRTAANEAREFIEDQVPDIRLPDIFGGNAPRGAEEGVQRLADVSRVAGLRLETLGSGLGRARVRMDELREASIPTSDALTRLQEIGLHTGAMIADAVGYGIGQVVEGIIMMEDGFRSLSDTLRSFGQMAQRIFARLIADITAAVAKAAALRGIATLFGIGTIGSFGSLLRGALGFGGARAMGGPVMSGQAYVVGERGPELFVPPSAGKIIPNHALGAVRSGPIDVRIRGEFVQRGGDLVATIDTVRRVQGY